ncbi:asparagine synthase (glutamine-hydrolyzing) [Streptomyces aurantiacus]|uniref:asparagine synthase (glutamine-hydrolyzing) n=1 Tax=Streptomyces aurantiacus TaxID=47760 RepID=A0A7G1P3Z6_9ACTN|nr:asparagine synthase (glutamine-hydrolyzing) [Streptomyces aurantiacus]BCL28564.1 asparagine synthase B [Streptomyces aurantiacus]
MCGIVAAVGEIDLPLCREMLARIAHRGPDDTGETHRKDVWLGHQRLSIMDPPGGHQPLVGPDGRSCLVVNGEIYNHLHLREELGPERFTTGSDSEAALQVLLVDGPAGLTRLRGMFTLAHVDEAGSLLVARDALGVKPLYWARKDGCVLFASELRAFNPADHPLAESFPPGCCWTPRGGLVRFADAVPPRVRPARRPQERITPDQWDETLLKTVRETIVSAVEDRMMSDVGIGVFLSGGLDSAIVTAVAAEYATRHGHRRPLPTFAVGTPSSPDLLAARVVAEYLGTEHHEVVMTPVDAVAALPRAVRAIEHFDVHLVRSAVPNLLLAEYASQHVRAVLTGEGADELFAGYPDCHREPFLAPEALQARLVETVQGLHWENLQRCDRTTMAYGLEARVPFLDRDVIELALSIPPEHKMIGPGAEEKKLLRDAFTGWLPEEILRRGKLQFGHGSGAKDVLTAGLTAGLTAAGPTQTAMGDAEEETAFYALWRDEFPGVDPVRALGRSAPRAE